MLVKSADDHPPTAWWKSMNENWMLQGYVEYANEIDGICVYLVRLLLKLVIKLCYIFCDISFH